ncbi:hypothetical protein N9Y92_03960 [Chlamydiales bacterium]|nr:hypothetical protein [Chlamydiales bacterium]
MDEEELENYITYWDNSLAIGERVRANHNASSYVALFIEYLPETLLSWLGKQLTKEDSSLDKVVEMVERNLQQTTTFINSKGMLHFDAHFNNILTDGERLYFSDFGLATSSQFTLSEEERQFIQTHQNYDRCYVATKLTSWIISNLFGKDRLEEVLQDYVNRKTPLSLPKKITPFLSSIIKRYAPITLKMNVFFSTLEKETKRVPYPTEELDQLWEKVTLLYSR